jgi:parvulin-like peptidyl-prolyl isomerase
MIRHTRSTDLAAALLLGVCLSAAAATAAEADLPPTTVAVVNGEAITLEDVEKRLEELHGEAGQGERSTARPERLLNRLVNDVLIGQEARVLGLHEESPVPETIERNRQKLALSLLERKEISGPSEPTPEEVAELFRERYRKATFRILTAADIEGAGAIVAALRDGVDVESVVAEMSIDPYAENGGLVEDVARKDLQLSVADVVFALSPKEVAGPVETDLGWSIVIAEEFGEPDPELLDEVRGRLERIVRQRKEAAGRSALVERLRQRHEVIVDRELVDSIQPVRRPDGRLTAESPGPDAVIATIGDEVTLSADDYAVALERRWRTIPEQEAARAAAPIILENLINQRLQLAEAYARGYHELPAVRRALHGLETELLIPKYLSSVLAAGLEVTEEEKRAEYERSREQLRRPPRMRFGQITVPSREQAEAIASALRGGSDLGWLARQHSTDGLREKGGLQEWRVIRADGGPISKKLLEAAPGTVLEPIQEEDSWVVYQVVAREEQGVFSYEEVSGNMREAVFRRKFTEVLDRFLKTARSRSEIEIRQDMLAGLRLSGTQEAADEPAHGGGHGGADLD